MAEEEIEQDGEEIEAETEAELARIESFMKRRPNMGSERRAFSHLWLVSYSDFMTIMMIFFLGLYGYTVLAKAALMHEQRKRVSYSDFAKMVSQIKGPLGESLEVQDDISKIILEMPDKILFSVGQAALNQEAKRTLEDVANSLKLVDGDIIVEGHTDNVPIKGGKYKSNWELSAARSLSVIEALGRAGVPQNRLAAWGFGENRPVATNTTVEGRAKNRRIEIVLLKKSSNNK